MYCGLRRRYLKSLVVREECYVRRKPGERRKTKSKYAIVTKILA